MYIKRHAETILKKYGKLFPVILVTGARQTGKSTLLQNTYKDYSYISFDNINQLNAIKSDVIGFLNDNSYPIIFDEIQLAGECFINIKHLVDKDRHNGMYFLTGSQKFSLMKNISDSLAGRVGIIELLGLSNREIFHDDFSQPFLPTKSYLSKRKANYSFSNNNLWSRIQRGSYPELYRNVELNAKDFYPFYIDTYLNKDIRQLEQVGNLLTFHQFLIALAARSGQLLNMASLGKEIGVDQRTIKKWLSILEASNIIYLLYPFSMNVTKRVVKTPKIYFLDTGLICYLCGWTSPDTAKLGAMNGQLFETFVLSEIIKSYYNAGVKPNIYFYKDSNANEIDFLIYEDNTLYPIEVKKTATPSIIDIKCFHILNEAYPTINIGDGGVICNVEEPIIIDKDIRAIPVNYI